MKTNTMMRVASVLLVAVLLSTCVISGTFAKYTTSATGSDSARVAKWGVTITTQTSGLFDDEYENEEVIGSTAVGAGFSVNSEGAATDYVVAPGTNGSVEFSITGTPEVAVDVKFDMTVTSDVIIPNGTEVAAGNTLAADYTPVVFTLTKKGTPDEELATGTLTQIKAKLDTLDAQYDAGTKLDTTYVLSWEWNITGNDAADTYLGNVAAGTVTDANTKTNIAFSFTIVATQIN